MIPVYLTQFHMPSHELLSRAAALHTGLPEAEFRELHTLPGGKPVFAHHPELHFSISHSGELWGCAFSEAEVGLDLQRQVEKPMEKIAARWFHPAEAAWLAACDYRDFFPIWCAKESFVKYTGRGIGGGFSDFAVADETGLLSRVDAVSLRHFQPEEGYFGCAAMAEAEEIRVIRF